jgi:hypothetical protein
MSRVLIMLNTSLFFRLSLVSLLALFAFGDKIGQGQEQRGSNQPVQLVNGRPQFQLHGQPFFAHSAAFFYNRIPRDEWGPSLARLKSMGINTVDLYIAWNWHEPAEGKLDFDGHSNPRRDVKGLLEMIDEMGFAVIARPGPVILNEWRNGGYPDWLLARPEYQMHETARLDGHYPLLCSLSPINSEEASRQWLANETHLKYTRKWFGEVMRELLKDRQATNGGNVIAIQLDDDQAINRANYNGPIFWKYMNTLADYLREAGATAPLYLNPTDMRVSAAGAPHNIGVMGQWYFNFGSDPALCWEDTATLQFYTETLKTQPHFPPMIIEYQAGWYGTGDDTYAKTADPTNTLLSSRVMMSHGLRGLNYFPVQDTLYPAGYEVPWANHYYIWESALTLTRSERPRAEAVHRNGRLIAGMGRELATANKAADIGLVYPISSYDQTALTRDDIMRISQAQMQIQQYCQLNQVAVEYIDLEFQPLEHLKRHRALMLPVFGQLSTVAQQKLVDYIKGGGKLIVTPALPEGDVIKQIADSSIVMPDFWRDVPIEPGKVSRDAVIAKAQDSSRKFIELLQSAGVQREVTANVKLINSQPLAMEPNLVAAKLVSGFGKPAYSFLSVANFDDQQVMLVRLSVIDSLAPYASHTRINLPEFTLRPRDSMMLPLRLPLGAEEGDEVFFATAELLKREAANGRIVMRFYAPDPAEAILSLSHAPQGAVTIDGAPTASSYDAKTKLLKINIASPRRGPKAKEEDEIAGRRLHEHDIEIVYEKDLPELTIKTTRLNIGENNSVAVEVSNRTSRPLKGKLSLTASRLFRSEQFSLDVDLTPRETKQFNFTVPLSSKAVADDQVILRASLATGSENKTYLSPSVTAEILPRFEWHVFPKLTWPLRADTQASINPPLIYPSNDSATEAKLNLRTGNNSAEEITLIRKSQLISAFPLKLRPDEEFMDTFTYNFAPGTKAALNPFNVAISDGKTTENATVYFVALRKGEAVAFAYDIDRDGFDDYILENDHLRLIISPEAGARSFALINKHTGVNVFTSVGGLRDKFVELDPQDPTRNPRRKRGMYGTFNRPYTAEIKEGMGKRVVLTLSYDAQDIYPAGARIERAITLNAGDEFFTVDYRVSPKPQTVNGRQAFWSSNSIVIGDPMGKARRFIASDGPFDFAPMTARSLNVSTGWLAAQISDQETFGVLWREVEVNAAEVEMKDFSSFVNLKFKPFANAEAHTYRLAYYFGAMRAEQMVAARRRILGG